MIALTDRERQILQEFKDAVAERLPHSVTLIKLFGSRARGDAEEWSDLDVLVVITDSSPSVAEEIRQIRYETMWRYDFRPLLSLLLLGEDGYDDLARLRAGLWSNIEREGVTLWQAT